MRWLVTAGCCGSHTGSVSVPLILNKSPTVSPAKHQHAIAMLHSGNYACRDQLGSTSPYKGTTTGHDWFTEITTLLSQLSELGYTMDRLRIYLTACVISVGEKYKRCLYFTVFMFKCQISCHPVSIGHSAFPRTMSGFGQHKFFSGGNKSF